MKGSRLTGVKVLIALELFLGISGIIGGIPKMIDPSGGIMGLPLSSLEGSPISDYFLVGVFLFGVFVFGL